MRPTFDDKSIFVTTRFNKQVKVYHIIHHIGPIGSDKLIQGYRYARVSCLHVIQVY